MNAMDPNRDGDGSPKELLYGRRMSTWLARLDSSPSTEVQLAVRAQHIVRWKIPRDSYPDGRAAYLRWRRDLGRFHADTAAGIMRESGYDEATVTRVRDIIQKKRLRVDPESQRLEDVACLVFLEHYFGEFARHQSRESMVNILARTWRKMSELARAKALEIEYSAHCRDLLDAALSPE